MFLVLGALVAATRLVVAGKRQPGGSGLPNLVTQFQTPGPVAASFLADNVTQFQVLNGPIGSAKTTTSMFKMFRLSAEAAPIWKDGVIRVKWLIVRETYERLQKNTLASWTKWFPPKKGEFIGGGGRPAEHNMRGKVLRYGDEWPIEYQFQFIAIGDNNIEDILRGYEPTFVWLNELDLQAEETLTHAWGRTGRYPTSADIMPGEKPAPRIAIADMNAPQDPEVWTYKRFFEGEREGHKLYRQPSGLSPQAENLHVLGESYYQDMLKTTTDKLYIRRMIKNEVGYSRDGEPVYSTYDDEKHVAPAALEFDPHLGVYLGMDQGLHPALVAGQWTHDGTWRIVAELLPGKCGVTKWSRLVNEFVDDYGIRNRIRGAYCDPSGFRGGDAENGDLAWTDSVAAATRINFEPAPSNEIPARLDAVEQSLWFDEQEGVPALRICPVKCLMLRRGFVSYYRYKRVKGASGGREYEDKPHKRNNPYADIHDALQYLMLGAKGLDGTIAGIRAPHRMAAQQGFHVPKMGWSPMQRGARR